MFPLLDAHDAATIRRAAANAAAAFSGSHFGAGSIGTARYMAACSRRAGRHIATNSGALGGHASPLVRHFSKPVRICSADSAKSAFDHNSVGVSP